MADSNPLDSNFLSYIFNANAPAGAPTSYAALDTRRKIALAMMMRERKGYPKNIGEGLTAIGDALGERGAMNALAQQEAADQKQSWRTSGGHPARSRRASGPAKPTSLIG